ncbi:siderophore-interacting protein [Cytophagaceae bacterium DM2B3-1]|uniref:Siderophore-interacting protein n=1 Tax=Xanthocytophaga flava TaxID=3048013 RepID=A0ABT7CPN3_9BACT|nr:siderophore-interacting protein [Xanthocytophaga flavus]MDJ1466281.1 siderophore-interacting protein [Xanthocytophaga flavus]MDJ1495486.1 siderophore-interacting protein [Xanthocytophaga flavus]
MSVRLYNYQLYISREVVHFYITITKLNKMGLIDNLASKLLNKAVIVHKSKIADNTFHIRIHSSGLKSTEYVPGYFLRIFCGMGMSVNLKDKIRSYSVWYFDRRAETIDIAVCTHSNGPGSKWAQDCAVGDTIYFGWHKGKFIVDQSADSYVLVGDTSALGHLYEIYRNLSVSKKIYGFVYAENEKDIFPDIDGSKPFQFLQLAANPGQRLVQSIDATARQISGSSMVYVGGDSRSCVQLNQYFKKELNWNSEQIKAKPFWNPDKTGLE